VGNTADPRYRAVNTPNAGSAVRQGASLVLPASEVRAIRLDRLRTVVLGALLLSAQPAVQAQAPLNDECTGAIPLPLGLVTGSLDGATPSASLPACVTIQEDVWFSYLAAETGLLTVATYYPGSASFDTVLAAYSGECGSLSLLACHDNMTAYTKTSLLEVPVFRGQHYFVRLGGKNVQSGDYTLAVSFLAGAVPTNDDCSSAQLVTAETVSGNTRLATWSGTKTYCGSALFKDVWFRYVAPVKGNLRVSPIDIGLGPGAGSGMVCIPASCTAQFIPGCTGDFCFADAAGAEAFASLEAGEEALIVIGAVGGLSAGGEFQLSIEFDPDVPEVFLNPANGHTYLKTPFNQSWKQSSAWAQSVQGHLVTLDDALEFQFLKDNFSFPASQYWIGLTDEVEEGVFEWVTGEPVTYVNWAPSQPDDNCFGSSEDFVTMQLSNGLMYDRTDSGCPNWNLGLVEIEGPAALAKVSLVGQGCPPDEPGVLGGTLPLLGAPLSLTVVDPVPGAVGAIFASASKGAVGSFGACEMYLDVATRFLVAPVATTGIGIDTVTIPIPADPALEGVSLVLQAYLEHAGVSTPTLTNGLKVELGY
jgi:hypothetical protein